MARSFRAVDRDQQFLLPPDMREWLPADHVAWFVIEVVGELDVSGLEARYRRGGVGRAAFDPRMMLALLIYAYATGQRSSRQIERLCVTDIAFRVICAQDPPDHTTIARFRCLHQDSVEQLFGQVLMLCARAGLGRVGVVAVDGTKIAANASIAANRAEDSLRRAAARIVAEAAEIDAAEDAALGEQGDPGKVPAAWSDPKTRGARIREALKELEARKGAAAERAGDEAAEHWTRRVEHAEAVLAATRARLHAGEQAYRHAQAEAAAGRGRPPSGRPPVPVEQHVAVREAKDRVARNTARRERAVAEQKTRRAQRDTTAVVNLTDPDSRVMPTQKGWVQGYNAQLAVTEDQIVVAAELTQDTGDVGQLVPMMAAADASAALLDTARGRREPIGLVLADAGYLSEDNLTAPGPDRLIAIGKRRELEIAARGTTAAPPEGTDPISVMRRRLETPDGIAAYRRRGCTVEPVNGHLKDRIGLRTFSRRGLAAARSELHLAVSALNLLKLHRALTATT